MTAQLHFSWAKHALHHANHLTLLMLCCTASTQKLSVWWMSLYQLKLKTSCQQKAPRRNATAVQLQKTECRKAECGWCKAKLQIHKEIFKDRLHDYNTMCKARQSFFSSTTNNNINNSRILLWLRHVWLNKSSAYMTPDLVSTERCNEFAYFTNHEIYNTWPAFRIKLPFINPTTV